MSRITAYWLIYGDVMLGLGIGYGYFSAKSERKKMPLSGKVVYYLAITAFWLSLGFAMTALSNGN